LAEPTATPAATCTATDLVPSYLPSGVDEVDRAPLVATPERWRTWTRDKIVVQVLDGISADRGDDPSARPRRVRGNDALSGPVETAEGSTALVVDWTEDSGCGSLQYAVAAFGINEAELIRIANSLEART
jgi:hypothetical protein